MSAAAQVIIALSIALASLSLASSQASSLSSSLSTSFPEEESAYTTLRFVA